MGEAVATDPADEVDLTTDGRRGGRDGGASPTLLLLRRAGGGGGGAFLASIEWLDETDEEAEAASDHVGPPREFAGSRALIIFLAGESSFDVPPINPFVSSKLVILMASDPR